MIKVGELKKMLENYEDFQLVVFAPQMYGEDCDVYGWVGNPVLKSELEDEKDPMIDNDNISSLPPNAIIFDLDY